jgi:methylmalonyl-CoA mutase, N-terminal domain
VRAERNAVAAQQALDAVRSTAVSEENLLPPMREALRVGSTIGEVCGALRELWGTYDAQHA